MRSLSLSTAPMCCWPDSDHLMELWPWMASLPSPLNLARDQLWACSSGGTTTEGAWSHSAC